MIELPELEPSDEWRLTFSDRSYDRNQYVEARIVRHVPRPKRGASEETVAASIAYVRDEHENAALAPDELVENTITTAVTTAHRAYRVGLAFQQAAVLMKSADADVELPAVRVETEP